MLSRRRFFGLLPAAGVAAAVAVQAAPAIAEALANPVASYCPACDCLFGKKDGCCKDAPDQARLGDTIMIRKPLRFTPRECYEFTWRSDEFVPVTLATPEDLARYREALRRM